MPVRGLKAATLAALRDFLKAWRDDGIADASARYLEPDFQTPAGQPGIQPVSGRVLKSDVYSRPSKGSVMLLVEMDLRFHGGHAAWGQGHNDRFVTGTRTSPTAPVRLAFATGP